MGCRTKVEVMRDMDERTVVEEEWKNSGTTWTRNSFFEENGYLIIKNLYDPKELYCAPPQKTGKYYWLNNNIDDVNVMQETQVDGSIERYWHPHYRNAHSKIRFILEKKIGRKLYNTYYYDRFYFTGQELTRHTDREACEISVSIHIGTNLKEEWPFYFKTPDKYTDSSKKELLKKGKKVSVNLNAGDGVVYKGCERPHWRDRMPGSYEEMNGHKKIYYHQIFFHYVLQDGIRAHYAFDRGYLS